MNKKINPLLTRIVVIIIIAIISVDLFLWMKIKTQDISEIKYEAHLKIKSALKIIDKDLFANSNKEILEKYANEIKKITNLRTTLIKRDGDVLGDSDVPLPKLNDLGNYITRPEVIDALQNHVGFVKRKSAALGTEFYFYCEPVMNDGTISGFIRFALPPENYNSRINFIFVLIILTDIIFILFGIFLYFSVKNLFKKKSDNIYSHLENSKRLRNYEYVPQVGFTPLDDIVQIINQIFDDFNLQQKTLKRDNEHLLRIFDSLSEGIAAFHSNGIISFANNNFSSILNLDDFIMENDYAYDIIKFPPLLKDINKFSVKQKSINRKIKYYDNKFLIYKVSKFKFDKDDIGFLVIVQNITKLHNLETIRSDFVANVSHEFKTPLTSIRGYSETLLANSVKDEQTRTRFLQKIRNQSVYLENLVSDLLKLNRIESKSAEEISEINICPVLNEIAAEFKLKAEAKKIIFHYENDCKDSFIVSANTKLIYNIVANLVANAIQYSKENGNIVLSAKVNNDIIRIEIKDDGIGISEKDKPRIFERFFRVDKASAIYAEGSGLGLSIVKNAVELISGNYGFESEENVGSLFWVELKKTKSLK